MSLLTYAETRPWAKAIREVVLTKKMAHWFADPAHGRFANDRTLSEGERDVLVAWANSGAMEGNTKDAAKPVEFADGWTVGKPHFILEMPIEYVVPAEGKVDYAYFVVHTGFTEDKWVESIEVRPGNRSVVHHIQIYSGHPGSTFMSEAKPDEPFAPPSKVDDAAAAQAVVDEFQDDGIDGFLYDRDEHVRYLVQSKWTKNGSGSIDVGSVLKFVQGVNHLLEGKVDHLGPKLQKNSQDIRDVLADSQATFVLIISYTGKAPVSADVQKPLDQLLEDLNDDADLVSLQILALRRNS